MKTRYQSGSTGIYAPTFTRFINTEPAPCGQAAQDKEARNASRKIAFSAWVPMVTRKWSGIS
jgi:hypothetical protein